MWDFRFPRTARGARRDNGKDRSGSDEADETRFTMKRARCRRRRGSFSSVRGKGARVDEGSDERKVANPSEQTAIKFISKTFRAKPCLFPFVSEVGRDRGRNNVSNS